MRTDRAGPALSTDAEPFADFYTAEHDGQVRRAYLLVGDAATAHDVVANAFLAIYQRWDHISQPGPYLNRCVLNGCRDVSRKRKREVLADVPMNDAGEVDRVDELADLLLGLTFRQRAAIVLRFYGGCSDAEIAQQLGCRPGTVGSLVHRGLRALHDLLDPEDDPDARR